MDGRSTAHGCCKKYQENIPRHFTQKPTLRGPKSRWKGDVENDRIKPEIVNWRQVAQDRDVWRSATKEVLILLGW
jgi:hypothetical protein